MSVLLLILGLILFIGLVVVHEFGHFIVAKRNGVVVDEFGIGFPPRAKTLAEKNGTKYTLNWLPLGGFVKLKGESDSDTTPGSFGAASLQTKAKILLAGVAMNLLAAFVLLTFLALIGMPQLIENQFTVKNDTRITRQDVLVGYIEPGSPADKAGLQVRDRIVQIAGNKVTSQDILPNITKKFAGSTAPVIIERGGKQSQLNIGFRTTAEVNASKNTDNPKGYLGITPTEYVLRRSTWSAPIVAAGLIKQFTILTFQGLGSAISNLFHGHTAAASAQVSGPVGIFVILKAGSLLGINFILAVIALVTLGLGIMNALPIPALDGGRMFLILLSRAAKKPLSEKTEAWVHGTGFALLMVLFVLITIVDIHRFY